eukprot:9431645-Pyramimonas_sp.AAC.1
MEVLGAHICSELHVNEHPDLDTSIDSARRAFWGQATSFRSTAICGYCTEVPQSALDVGNRRP